MKFGATSHRLILIGLVVLTVLTVAVVLTVGGGALIVAWDRYHTLYPTAETESAFLKTYTPVHVIEQFRCNESPSYAGPSLSSAAGKEFITHGGGFDLFFVLRSDKWLPLMMALNDDAYQQLGRNGAQILNRSGDAQSGFHFDYRLGKSIGSLMITPLTIPSPSPIHRQYTLQDGTADVKVHIEQREMWFPKEPSLPSASQLQELHAINVGT
jgi:hypothetical protein